MAITRLYLQNQIKSALGIARSVDDGLLPDTLIQEAINETLKQIAGDCNLNPDYRKLALRADKWKYPMDEDVAYIRKVWFVDTDGRRSELDYAEPDNFMEGLDPEDTGSQPDFFSYPYFQRPVLHFYVGAPPIYDYIDDSNVTTRSIRTVIDSAANFGRLLDGTRIKPKWVVHNITDDSYGYVEVLDTTTAKVSGTTDAGTNSTTLIDAGVDFVATSVAVDDIICLIRGGIVVAYAFVTAVAVNQLTYEGIQGIVDTFILGDLYKVGRATEIRLSMDAPHPGLRDGANNRFAVSDVAKATINGTTFTPTRCTGAGVAGSEEGDIAIAAGGSHGRVSAATSTYVDVDMWRGGQPADGEVVSVRECDQYQVEHRFRTQRVMWITPAPSASATLGTENLRIWFNATPTLPENDDDPIEVPNGYMEALVKCGMWKARFLQGIYSHLEIRAMEEDYKDSAKEVMGDVFRSPPQETVTPWTNRRNVIRTKRWGERDQGPSGARWTLPD